MRDPRGSRSFLDANARPAPPEVWLLTLVVLAAVGGAVFVAALFLDLGLRM